MSEKHYMAWIELSRILPASVKPPESRRWGVPLLFEYRFDRRLGQAEIHSPLGGKGLALVKLRLRGDSGAELIPAPLFKDLFFGCGVEVNRPAGTEITRAALYSIPAVPKTAFSCSEFICDADYEAKA